MFPNDTFFSSSGNATSVEQTLAQQLVTWIALVVMILALFTNGLCLIAFIQERRLRTVFNYYLINLTLTDIFYTAISLPCFITLNYHGYWPFGRGACTFYLWADWTFSACVEGAVLLIGFDRIWALYYPFNYRDNHSKKVTVVLIACMWVWVQMCMLPGIIASHYAESDPQLCEVSMETPLKRAWDLFVNLANYIVPQVLLIISFVLIAYKISTKKKVQVAKIPTVSCSSSRNQDNQVSMNLDNTSGGLTSTVDRRSAKERRLFRMFTYLTISMAVCWGPGDVFWTMYNLDPSVYEFSLASAMSLLMFCNAVTNPLLYQTGSNEMQKTLLRLIGTRTPGEKLVVTVATVALREHQGNSSLIRKQSTD